MTSLKRRPELQIRLPYIARKVLIQRERRRLSRVSFHDIRLATKLTSAQPKTQVGTERKTNISSNQ